MKKIAALVCALCLVFACAARAESLVGSPCPDFTVTLTDGTQITLSKLLEEKQLVVLNVFASWCPPCRAEFPEMESVYRAYAGQIEILAVSGYEEDTLEILADYKAAVGLSFPVGRAGDALDFIPLEGYPTTLFIDRFGGIGLYRLGAFAGAEDFEAAVQAFLGDDYAGKQVGLYNVYVGDQYGDPVPQAYVSFCTDTACRAVSTGEDGMATLLTEEPCSFHVQVMKAPAGYRFDPEDGAEAGPDSGWTVLQVTKE